MTLTVDTSPRPVLEYVFGVGWRTVSDVCWRAVPSHWYRMKTCEAADAFGRVQHPVVNMFSQNNSILFHIW